LLAGGTDLLVQLREGMRTADLVVDLKKIPELMEVRAAADGSWRVGAAVPCHRLAADERFCLAYPAIMDSVKLIGGWQIQGRASLGGNLCNASPAADGIPPLMVCGAVARLAGPQGERTLAVDQFCTAPGKSILQPGELLVGFDLPAPQPRSSSHYLRFIPRNEMDIAVVGVGAWIQLADSGKNFSDAKIALAAVAPRPVWADEAMTWLRGQPATEAALAQAAELAQRSARPISDVRGPADYRKHLVAVLTRRALQEALQRASASLGRTG